MAILDAFHFDLSEAEGITIEGPIMKSVHGYKISDDMTTDKPIHEEDAEEETVGPGEQLDDDDDDALVEEEDLDDRKVRRRSAKEKSQQEKSQPEAVRILNALVKRFLPELYRCVGSRVWYYAFLVLTRRMGNFRYLKKKEGDNWILRVPVALAIVNLLTHLPKAQLHLQLPQLLTKIAVVLRDRSTWLPSRTQRHPLKSNMHRRHQSIRDTARSTILRIADTLGPYYLPFIIKELQHSLTKG